MLQQSNPTAVLILAAFVLFVSENLLFFAVSRLPWKKTAKISSQYWAPQQQLSKFPVTSEESAVPPMEDSAVERFEVHNVVCSLRELPNPQRTVAIEELLVELSKLQAEGTFGRTGIRMRF